MLSIITPYLIYIYKAKKPSVCLSVTSVSRHFCMDWHQISSKWNACPWGTWSSFLKGSNPCHLPIHGASNIAVYTILAETSPTFLQNRSPDTIENIYYNSYSQFDMLYLLWWLCNRLNIQKIQIQILGCTIFSLVKLFVMDKECTMRAPKARSYGAQPPVRAPKARLYGTHPILHDRAGTFASSYI